MDNPFISPALLSFCPGMLGLERGLESVIGPVRTLAYVEIEAFIIENLVKQMEQGVLDPAPIWSNVKTFPIEKFYGYVHGITGGFPCQPFSYAGLRKAQDDPRHLWPSFVRCIKKSRPTWCWFENVEGLITAGLNIVLKDLHKLGYAVEVGLFSASEVGAPHRRNRVFILAVENSQRQRMRGWYDQIIERQQNRRSKMANAGLIGSNEGMGGEQPGLIDAYGLSWPARPGQQQHAWERPRTESKLGYAINGYNFREDLLRMAGNAVVEQQAAKAFITLFEKFT